MWKTIKTWLDVRYGLISFYDDRIRIMMLQQALDEIKQLREASDEFRAQAKNLSKLPE